MTRSIVLALAVLAGSCGGDAPATTEPAKLSGHYYRILVGDKSYRVFATDHGRWEGCWCLYDSQGWNRQVVAMGCGSTMIREDALEQEGGAR